MLVRALAVGVSVVLGAALPGGGTALASASHPAAATAATAPLAAPASAHPAAARVVKLRLRKAVQRLPVAKERRRGYDRDKFTHWIDANDDCQDTRDEVLDAESRIPVSGCDIRTGRWRSPYDGEVWTDASDVDIDHLVPLAEAWDSGARRWNADTRKRFANDLGDRRALVAVTDNVNQSKSDQDPADWLPELRQCTYVRQWVAVKLRWGLDVDRGEKRALKRRASDCKNGVLRVREARVVAQGNDGGGGDDGEACAPGYSPCVPPPPPDLDCADLDGPIYVTGSDPHHLDADGDGVGCE